MAQALSEMQHLPLLYQRIQIAVHLARALMRLKKLKGAIPCFDEALKIDPNLAVTKKNKELCLAIINAQKSASSKDSSF